MFKKKKTICIEYDKNIKKGLFSTGRLVTVVDISAGVTEIDLFSAISYLSSILAQRVDKEFCKEMLTDVANTASMTEAEKKAYYNEKTAKEIFE